ncbi:ribosome silencing factor [soil metagenome]
MIEGQELALAICDCADQKLAEDIVVIDLRGISSITDYFVICTGTSLPHLRAIRKEIVSKLAESFQKKLHMADGEAESQWLVLDFGDVIAHVFNAEKRAHYALEDLWSDAPRVEWSPADAPRG